MADTLFTIPVENIPQDFNITLSGLQLRTVCKWNEFCGWLLDIYDATTQEPLIMALPLVVGCDILEQYKYTGIPGAMIVYTDGDQYAAPTLTNLGVESNLYYLVNV